MKINLIAVGERMPAWVNAGFEDYRKRLPPELSLMLRAVPLAPRGRNYAVSQCLRKEAEAMLAQLGRNDHVIALQVTGKVLDTRGLADRLEWLRGQGRDISLLVGGPDGLGDACLARAAEQWSLSALTLPHPLVRVVIAEQLYRAWSLLQGHPYHRE